MKNESSYWVKTIQNGLIGGGIALLLSLIGLSVAFKSTYIISGIFTMGQVFAFSPILFESYMSVRKANSKNATFLLMVGGLTGLLGGAVLVFTIAIQQVINLRSVLINFSPDLIKLLTFNLSLVPGLLVLLGACLLLGIVATGLFLLPDRFREVVIQGLLTVIVLGLFRDLLVTVIISGDS